MTGYIDTEILYESKIGGLECEMFKRFQSYETHQYIDYNDLQEINKSSFLKKKQKFVIAFKSKVMQQNSCSPAQLKCITIVLKHGALERN